MDKEEFNTQFKFENSKTRNLPTGTVVYEKSSSGQIIANVIPNKKVNNLSKTTIKRSPLIQEMKYCPIDESNVENVLDRMVLVTESLQQLLQTYKDDLKKTGGGFVPRPSELKPNILKKRLEIAEKLTSTYATYRQAVDDIAELEIGGGDILKEYPLTTPNPVYSPPPAVRKPATKWPKIEVKNKATKNALAKITHQTAKKQQQATSAEKPRNFTNTPKPKSALDSKIVPNPQKVTNIDKRKIPAGPKLGNTEKLGKSDGLNVSNDLFMSCEACVEEDVYSKAEDVDSNDSGEDFSAEDELEGLDSNDSGELDSDN